MKGRWGKEKKNRERENMENKDNMVRDLAWHENNGTEKNRIGDETTGKGN